MDQEAGIACLPSSQCDYVVFTESESQQTDQSDQLHSEFGHKQTDFGDLALSDASNPNDDEADDQEGGQQWTQVDRSSSSRHSNKKRMKNSSSQEFSHSVSFHNQGLRRTGSTNGPFPHADPIYGARYRNSRPYDHNLAVNGQNSQFDATRVEAYDKSGSVISEAQLSSSQVMPYNQNFHSYDPGIDRPPYRPSVRYRGRPPFRPIAESDHGTVRCPTTLPLPANDSFGRIVRSSHVPSAVAPQASQPIPRRLHHSLPFPPRASNSYYRYNFNPSSKPYANQLRSYASGTNSSTNPPDVRVSVPATVTLTPTAAPTEQAQAIPSVGEPKATWAATVAASPRSRVNEKYNSVPEMTAALFLSNQWRLFCEQQHQQQS